MAPIVLITRPAPEGPALGERLRRDHPGLAVRHSPLIAIQPEPLPPLPADAALIFTSRNGVRAAAGRIRPGTIAYCVGDATARAAREAGCTVQSAGGDAEALFTLIRDAGPAGPLLHLHGEHQRGDLAARLNAEGLAVRSLCAYRQRSQPFTTEARALMSGSQPVVAPIYSPRTGRLFAEGWHGTAPLFLAAISPAVAAELNGLERFRLCHAAHPDGESMVAVTNGLIAAALQLEAGGPCD
ncbi:uroporphyrinogen-III synthase [Pseudooceanicola sp. CBS1P-1]|uniref:Uroporphyrinogen-III synthase n=1 Tax=Pseudooceanicola albus TaxID=2692189 RepID=A0A6L7G7K8_9RHOB|nr:MULTISPECIES: uroporphyrinogen-III synthase [Pseudooceanicola]MBT9385783.1 uroporphyrinogen-III synthase [Pseudooceanicola endophyticus]MXN20015.1 uroporphyrinogen-III synthase [Pseudooceanicola albus]